MSKIVPNFQLVFWNENNLTKTYGVKNSIPFQATCGKNGKVKPFLPDFKIFGKKNFAFLGITLYFDLSI